MHGWQHLLWLLWCVFTCFLGEQAKGEKTSSGETRLHATLQPDQTRCREISEDRVTSLSQKALLSVVEKCPEAESHVLSLQGSPLNVKDVDFLLAMRAIGTWRRRTGAVLDEDFRQQLLKANKHTSKKHGLSQLHIAYGLQNSPQVLLHAAGLLSSTLNSSRAELPHDELGAVLLCALPSIVEMRPLMEALLAKLDEDGSVEKEHGSLVWEMEHLLAETESRQPADEELRALSFETEELLVLDKSSPSFGHNFFLVVGDSLWKNLQAVVCTARLQSLGLFEENAIGLAERAWWRKLGNIGYEMIPFLPHVYRAKLAAENLVLDGNYSVYCTVRLTNEGVVERDLHKMFEVVNGEDSKYIAESVPHPHEEDRKVPAFLKDFLPQRRHRHTFSTVEEPTEFDRMVAIGFAGGIFVISQAFLWAWWWWFLPQRTHVKLGLRGIIFEILALCLYLSVVVYWFWLQLHQWLAIAFFLVIGLLLCGKDGKEEQEKEKNE